MSARAHYVAKAAKDNPVAKKGESYWYWSFYKGPKQYSKEKPNRSQLTRNEHELKVYEFEDRLAEFGEGSTKDDVQAFLDEVQEYYDELESRKDNLPEQFQETGPGEIIQERLDMLSEAISELESIISEIESTEHVDEEELVDELVAELFSNVSFS